MDCIRLTSRLSGRSMASLEQRRSADPEDLSSRTKPVLCLDRESRGLSHEVAEAAAALQEQEQEAEEIPQRLELAEVAASRTRNPYPLYAPSVN